MASIFGSGGLQKPVGFQFWVKDEAGNVMAIIATYETTLIKKSTLAGYQYINCRTAKLSVSGTGEDITQDGPPYRFVTSSGLKLEKCNSTEL